MMRNLVAIAPGNPLSSPELTGEGGICSDDLLIRIRHDARLWQVVEEGKQLTEKMGSHAESVTIAKNVCQN